MGLLPHTTNKSKTRTTLALILVISYAVMWMYIVYGVVNDDFENISVDGMKSSEKVLGSSQILNDGENTVIQNVQAESNDNFLDDDEERASNGETKPIDNTDKKIETLGSFVGIISTMTVLVTLVVQFYFRSSSPSEKAEGNPKENPLEILKIRYAKGDIDKTEFDEIKKGLV